MSLNYNKPNFFIVGGPKCGTSALQRYLSEHPDIYMPTEANDLETLFDAKKEFHFFGSDLHFQPYSLDEYLSFFDNAQDAKAIGETSVFYLYSQKAAQEIYHFNPNAKIIIMIRNPIDVIHSWHSQLVFWGDEVLQNFEDALMSEHERKKGFNLPLYSDHPPECFYYTEIPRFSEQIKRYIEFFKQDQLLILVFDDFVRDTAESYQKVLEFLCVDNSYKPESFSAVNMNKQIKNRALFNFFKNPTLPFKSKIKFFIPQFFYRQIKTIVLKELIVNKKRENINNELRQHLCSSFRQEVTCLSQLLNRDLTPWLK